MDTPTGRPVVCRQCGKVNRTGDPDCERCGHALRSDTGGDERSKTSPGRKRLVTRQSEDGSLVMVQLSPEEAEAEEIEIGHGLTGEHELEPAVADAGDGDPRRKKVLFGAVASAGILVALLAWPFAGSDDEKATGEPEAVTTPTASRGPRPRKPKLPPLPPPERPKPEPVVDKPAPAAPPEDPATTPSDTPKEAAETTGADAKKEEKAGAPKAEVIEPDKEEADEEGATETKAAAEGSEGDGEGGDGEAVAEGASEGADDEKIAEGADAEGGESTDEGSPSDDEEEEEEEDAAEE